MPRPPIRPGLPPTEIKGVAEASSTANDPLALDFWQAWGNSVHISGTPAPYSCVLRFPSMLN